MRYSITPDDSSRATHTRDGHRYRIRELADSTLVHGPVQPATDISAYTPIPPPVPPAAPVPALTARQLRLWLLSDGLTPAMIDAQIAAIPDAAAKARAQVEWEYATEYKRDHPLVAQVGAALSLTSAQIDAAFRAAALL